MSDSVSQACQNYSDKPPEEREIRRPKVEGRKKAETRRPKAEGGEFLRGRRFFLSGHFNRRDAKSAAKPQPMLTTDYTDYTDSP